MKSFRILLLCLSPFAFLASATAADKGHGEHHGAAAGLTKEQRKFLSNYEGVRAALASDDLAAAKRSAANLSGSSAAGEIAKATSLEVARESFKKLSTEAVALAKGQEGYYVATCPMARADWVQTSPAISNPYYGKSMLTCGSIKN